MTSFRHAFLASLLVLTSAFPALAQSAGSYTICVDPGHGGTDPGALTKASLGCSIASLIVNGNLEEADVVLDTGKKLRDYLDNAGFKTIYMTRDADTTVSLAERSSFANAKGCTRFVSIHANAGGGTGIETFCHSNSSTSSPACVQGQNIQDEMLKQWPLTNRKLKKENFHVLRETTMPATLTELAFMDTCAPDVNSYLSVASKRTSAALAHLYALQTSLGLAQGTGPGTIEDDPGTTPGTTAGKAAGVLFEDVGVGTNDMTTRISGGMVTVNGKSVTTDANGNWSFSDLTAGTYTLAGAASGYDGATKSCTITAGGTSWCSFGLTKSNTPTTETGTIIGVVYDTAIAEATGSTSGEARLPSASVENVETGVGYALTDMARFEFSVIDGKTYTIRASLGGYESGERQCIGAANTQVWCSFGLRPLGTIITTGTLKGTVYQNGNTSDFVAPATVRLSTGDSANYAGASEWIFTDLPPASYSVTVSATGYDTKTYACPTAVTAGGTAQCDVELTKSLVTDPDPENPEDPEDPEDPDPTDPSDPLDPSEPSEPMNPGTDTNNTPTNALTTSGCSSSSENSGVGFGLVLFALSALFMRRRPVYGTALLAAAFSLGLIACSDDKCEEGSCSEGSNPGTVFHSIAVSPKAEMGASVAVAAELIDATRRVPSFIQAGAVETIADGGGWMAPVFAPDGESIAFTKSGMKGLYLRELTPREAGRRLTAKGAIRTLTEEDGAGFEPRFSRDGKRLAYRVPGQPFHAMPQQLITREGTETRPFHLTNALWVLNPDDTIVLRQGKIETVIAASAMDRFYRPFITPDSRWVIYNGLYTGVYGYRIADGKTVYFGPGSHASASEDGRYLAFSVTEDDGQEILRATLHVANLRSQTPRTCAIEMGDELVLHPSLSVLRSAVVFSGNDGRIRLAPLTFNQ